ncbi:MAG: hypothetical protein DHS20C15_18050 [Planctomycetota bacterium]|nr:MAG: hypothetical protein DHS20C15_18050 [Planctomycetota bacterium]
MTSTESIVIDGYDLLAEVRRLTFADQVVCGRRLNRGTASVSTDGTPHPDYADVKSEHVKQIVPSTLSGPVSPAIDLSWPTAGMFVASPAGVYLDLYQGVAQKLVDEHHPRVQGVIRALAESGLAFRREINTDDFMFFGDAIEGLVSPVELGALMNRFTGQAFPEAGGFRTFFSNSGAESGEAALKLAQLHAYRRLQRSYGDELIAAVMADLGIERDAFYDADTNHPDPVYNDYPLFIFGCDFAFHGRTLGVLNLTRSKKAQHIGYSKLRWVRHVPFNGSVEEFTALLDDRPLPEIMQAEGVAAVIAAGKVPSELAAGFFTEVFQGEGGYRLADPAWLSGIAEACQSRGILFGTDEVQSFGRTGELFATQHFDVTPDLVWTAKAAVLGMTMVRSSLVDDCHQGWHSNTFGSGKLFDVNLAYTCVDMLVNQLDEHLDGRSYLENSRIKGEYIRMRLAELSSKHDELFPDFSGLGCMWGLSVRHRAKIVDTGWRMGLKLLGCGGAGEVSRLRILLLSDVLTREIDEIIDALDRVFTAVEAETGIEID